ncbi:MAG: phosphohydrolase [Herbinix sp.]|nr:phosphohydrolase [Herbinix sp.]
MKLSEADKNEFIRHIRELLENEKILEMNQYIQHGNTTTFSHCFVVAYYSYMATLRIPFKFDTRSVIRGAMLHDYYLYDWHIPDKSHKLHGFKHPGFALVNARKDYNLSPIEEDIIEKHMWPLTINKAPIYKEAMLVCLVDKFCSLTETLYIPFLPKDIRQLRRMLNNKGFVF